MSVPAVTAIAAGTGAAWPAAVERDALLSDYQVFCAGLDRGPSAVGLRLRTATAFLAACGELSAWMTRPLDARLADLRRFHAWPLICYAALTGRLRCDADLLVAKKLGGFGRCAEDLYPADFGALRAAAGRLSWGPQFTEQVIRQGLVVAIAFTGRPPRELRTADIDELDAAIEATPHVGAAQRHGHLKRLHGVRRLLYEARICDTPPPSRRASTSHHRLHGEIGLVPPRGVRGPPQHHHTRAPSCSAGNPCLHQTRYLTLETVRHPKYGSPDMRD